jgi:hypothetical protein
MYETHQHPNINFQSSCLPTYEPSYAPLSTHLQRKFPLEDQVDLVARGSQEEVFLHLETLPRGLRGRNDFVFTQDSADMQSQLQVGKIHASAAKKSIQFQWLGDTFVVQR